ncbi:hypothetical protein FOA43_004161 [Brettanomyces nanus]|uniref:Protein PXR1 n=1 Tax=Eeniella nana TaxID=13502 RepID=A0A875RX98_EENNA|nr:uncharacterized protein FOA43_004161 [Brettanomyces nanus]QPG76767.1 hypothetical protein FOA43_004161 [Brettanomyces nanus]
MGLAAPRKRQKIGLDPRNIKWLNDKDRFGHRFLVNMGWKPGEGLGRVEHAITTHIRVKVKRDNLGLGAGLAKRRGANGSELDAGDNTYLDNFQKLLGRLNGKEDEINSAVEIKRKDRIISGKRGMGFVRGATLSSTWDQQNRKLKRKPDEENEDERKAGCEKEKLDEQSSSDDEDHHGSSKNSGKGHQHRHHHHHRKEKSKKSESKSEKHHHHHHHHHNHHNKKQNSEDRKRQLLTPLLDDSYNGTPTVLRSKLALRSKWIKQKRAAVMDAKALQEIFMVR